MSDPMTLACSSRKTDGVMSQRFCGPAWRQGQRRIHDTNLSKLPAVENASKLPETQAAKQTTPLCLRAPAHLYLLSCSMVHCGTA